jgi:glycosyl transferase family 87
MASMRTVALCAFGVTLIAAGMWFGPRDADDFGPFYRAGGLVSAHRSVYSSPLWSPERAAVGRFLPYLRIPSYAAALTPLAALPYELARRVWIAALLIASFACVWLYPGERNRLAVALAFSFPLANALIVGQDICFVLLIVFAAARIFLSGREFLAGVVASLLCIKITFLPAAGVVFLAKSRRGTWGLLAGTVLQLAISFVAGGSNWPSEYFALLRNPLLDPEPARMLNIREITTTLGLPAAVYVIAGAALYVVFWFACKRFSMADGLAMALALGLIASPHSKPYDGAVLIPLFVIVVSRGSVVGAFAFLGLTPVLYLMVLMGSKPVMLAGCALVVALAVAAGLRLYATAPSQSRLGMELSDNR